MLAPHPQLPVNQQHKDVVTQKGTWHQAAGNCNKQINTAKQMCTVEARYSAHQNHPMQICMSGLAQISCCVLHCATAALQHNHQQAMR